MKNFKDFESDLTDQKDVTEGKALSIIKVAGAAVYVSKIRDIARRIRSEDDLARKMDLLSEQVSLQTYVNAMIAYKVFSA